nr:hypothetical protein [uncultured Celeribacter sp.]
MRQLVDGILYIDSLSGLIAHFLEHRPDLLKTDGEGTIQTDPYVIVGFDRTPITYKDDTALVYIRVEEADVAEWIATPHVTILAQRPYGPAVQDLVYADLFADPAALALYDSVYDRTPYPVDDGEGGEIMVTPPVRFGQMG